MCFLSMLVEKETGYGFLLFQFDLNRVSNVQVLKNLHQFHLKPLNSVGLNFDADIQSHAKFTAHLELRDERSPKSIPDLGGDFSPNRDGAFTTYGYGRLAYWGWWRQVNTPIRAKTKGARPSLCPQPGTLRPNPPKAPAPAHCGLDQSANSDTCDRRNPTLNSDATCLKLVDTLRVTTRDKCRGDFKHALNTLQEVGRVNRL